MTQYVDKSALVAEIKKRIKYYQAKNQKWGVAGYAGRVAEGEEILSFINTLEVVDLELEKEIDDWYNTMGIPVTTDALKETARHFFRLGLNTQKGE